MNIWLRLQKPYLKVENIIHWILFTVKIYRCFMQNADKES